MGTTTTANYGWTKPDGNEPRSNWPAQWGASVDDIDFEVDAIHDRVTTLETNTNAIRNHIACFQHATGAVNSLSTGDNPEVILNWTLRSGYPSSGTSGISYSAGEFTIANAGIYEVHYQAAVESTVASNDWTAQFSIYINPTISAGLVTAGTPVSSIILHHIGGTLTQDSSMSMFAAPNITASQKIVVTADLLAYGGGGGNFNVPTGDFAYYKELLIKRIQ